MLAADSFSAVSGLEKDGPRDYQSCRHREVSQLATIAKPVPDTSGVFWGTVLPKTIGFRYPDGPESWGVDGERAEAPRRSVYSTGFSAAF
jgi:hypothetical protein